MLDLTRSENLLSDKGHVLVTAFEPNPDIPGDVPQVVLQVREVNLLTGKPVLTEVRMSAAGARDLAVALLRYAA